jgi:uncharacterized protein
MKAVFDTNVLVAAFLTEGVCATLLGRARRRECELVLSAGIITELTRILHKKFRLSSAEVSEVSAIVTEAAREILRETDPITPVCRDADDDAILACARTAGADFIVTGDADLLVLGRYGATRIVAPRDFEGLFVD